MYIFSLQKLRLHLSNEAYLQNDKYGEATGTSGVRIPCLAVCDDLCNDVMMLIFGGD